MGLPLDPVFLESLTYATSARYIRLRISNVRRDANTRHLFVCVSYSVAMCFHKCRTYIYLHVGGWGAAIAMGRESNG